MASTGEPVPAVDHTNSPPNDEEEVREALLAGARAPCQAAPPKRFSDLPERRLKVASRMLKRPGTIHRMMWGWLFRRVAFDERHIDRLHEAHRTGDVVLVMHHHSLLDYLYFNYAFLRFGLPLVYFANHITMQWFKPAWKLVFSLFGRLIRRRPASLTDPEVLAYGLERGRPALLFVKRRGLWPWSPEQPDDALLEVVLTAQLERETAVAGSDDQVARPIFLIPQLLVWSQNPNRYKRTLSDMVFGDPEAPGRLRKGINFLINRRRAFVQLGDPINVSEFLANESPALGTQALAAKLRYEIMQRMQREERVIKGPILKDARRIRQEILRTPEMTQEIRRLAEKDGVATEVVESRVQKYLQEMGADFSMSYIEMMLLILTVTFERMYSEIVADLDGLERVREAGREAPLVLLPCHRSHVDYLVISYLFYVNGLICPHIAAGQNLNFFPLGHIFRRCGAFFLRRSFKTESEAYRMTFREYVRKLVREGYWLEFFPEGGRSRTGKMLPPKLGVLGTIIDSIRTGSAPDVRLVPIYVGYERVIEERAYKQELTGASKKRENITGLLKTTQVLWSKFGRLYVSFAEPFSVKEAIDEAGVGDLEADDPRYKAFVRRMGYRVLSGIQDVALVTPSALTALALLMHPTRGVHRENLLRKVGFLLNIACHKGAPLSKTIEHALKINRPEVATAVAEAEEAGQPSHPLALGEASDVALARGVAVQDAVDEVLSRYETEKFVTVHNFEKGNVYTLADDQRMNLEFYKNNIVHLFIPEAILAAALRSQGAGKQATEAALREAASFLSQTLKYDFVYDPAMTFDEQFDRSLAAFENAGLIDRRQGLDAEGPGLIRATSDPRGQTVLAGLHQILQPWLESYWILASTIDESLTEEISQKEFFRTAQTNAQRRFQVGDIRCPESASSVTFKHALDAYVEMDLVSRRKKGRDTLLVQLPARRDDATAGVIASRLSTYFSR
ncbi:MAG: 1-acyl-sn-glycerol-3-phosphate acyltransferase [Myxococcota bacterium]